MARPLRIEYPGAVYHVTSRGNARKDIFVDDGDRAAFLEVLAKAVDRLALSRVLPDGQSLSSACRDRRYDSVAGHAPSERRPHPSVQPASQARSGHLLQGRYKAVLVEKDSHLLELARYVVLNPVRARMVRPCKDWRWSSYEATAGLESAPSFLTTEWILSQFGQSPSFVHRPSIEGIFVSTSETCAIATAYREYGYRLREIAEYLGVHYSTVRRRLKQQEERGMP